MPDKMPKPGNISQIYFTMVCDVVNDKCDEKFWIAFKSFLIEDIEVRIKDYLTEQGVLCLKPQL